jgi:hypothetical protein
MENPMVKQIIYFSFGMFYMLCLGAAAYALLYYSAH